MSLSLSCALLNYKDIINIIICISLILLFVFPTSLSSFTLFFTEFQMQRKNIHTPLWVSKSARFQATSELFLAGGAPAQKSPYHGLRKPQYPNQTQSTTFIKTSIFRIWKMKGTGVKGTSINPTKSHLLFLFHKWQGLWSLCNLPHNII